MKKNNIQKTSKDVLAGNGTKPNVRCSKKRLTAPERKIYNAVMLAFPATSHDSALNAAMQGGVKFDFRHS